MDLKPDHLTVNLHTDSQQERRIVVYFLKGFEPIGSAIRQASEPSVSKNYYFKFPDQAIPDGAFIDLEGPPSVWSMNKIGVHSHLLFFGMDAYWWKPSYLAGLAGPQHHSTGLWTDDGLKVQTLSNSGRFYIPLDYAKLGSTFETMIVKLFSILCVIGLFALLFSSYFWQLFATRKIDTEDYRRTFESLRQSNKVWTILGSLVLFITLVILSYPYMVHPSILIEDTMELSDTIAGGVNLLDPQTYNYYRGYPVFLTKWFASAAGVFPLVWQPTLYLGISILMMCLAMTTMAYSGIFTTRFMLLFGPLALFTGGFSVPPFYITLTGTLFTTTALLMALAVRPAPVRNFTWLPYLALIAILSWSGPYESQMLPLAVASLLLMGSGKKAFILAFMILLAAAYTLSSAEGMVQLSNILDSSIRTHFFRALVQYVFLLELFPDADYTIGLLIILAIVGVMVRFRDDRIYIKHSLIFLAVLLTSLLTFFISFKYHQYNGVLIPAHTIVSQYCWIIFILLSCDKMLQSLNNSAVAKVVGLILLSLCVVVFIAKGRTSTQLYQLKVENNTPDFIKAVNYAKTVDLKKDEFIQLWKVDQYNMITSAKFGSNNADAKSIAENRVPSEFLRYFLPISLDRGLNMMLLYDSTQNRINYSDQTTKAVPKRYFHRNRSNKKIK